MQEHLEIISAKRDPDMADVLAMLKGAGLNDDELAAVSKYGSESDWGLWVLSQDGVVGDLLNAWINSADFRSIPSKKTKERYALSVTVAARYGTACGVPIHNWQFDEVQRYREERLTRSSTVQKSTFDTELVGLRDYFNFLVRNNHRQTLPWSNTQYRRMKSNLVNESIRSISNRSYRYWRDIGLGGLAGDLTADESFNGHHVLRNTTYANLMVLTGMRDEEQAVLTMLELPAMPKDRTITSVPLTLPRAIVKYRRTQRTIEFPTTILRQVHQYVESERWVSVERNQAALRRRLRDGRLKRVVEVDRAKGRVRLAGLGLGWRNVASLGPEDRLSLVFEEDGLLQPLVIWASGAGPAVLPATWTGDVFASASERAQEQQALHPDLSDLTLKITPHMLRYTFGVSKLRALMEARKVLDDQLSGARARGDVGRADAIAATLFDPLSRVQELLGHRSPETTLNYLKEINRIDASRDIATRSWAGVWLEGADTQEARQ